MKKEFRKLIFISCFTLGFIFLSVAVALPEDITITTYYPAPFGVYKELRTVKMAIGATYGDPIQHCWPGGSCAFPDIDANADLIVEGNVGIGTVNPDVKLEVNGKVRIGDGINSYTLPDLDGAIGEVLVTDGSGTVSWGVVTGGVFPAPAYNSGWRPYSARNTVTLNFPIINVASADDLFVDLQVKTNTNWDYGRTSISYNGISNILTSGDGSDYGPSYAALTNSSIKISMGTNPGGCMLQYRVRIWSTK